MVNQITLIIILLFIFAPSPIYAYMDPGTWSYIFSIIVALFAGMMFYIRIIVEKIKLFFGKLFNINKKK